MWLSSRAVVLMVLCALCVSSLCCSVDGRTVPACPSADALATDGSLHTDHVRFTGRCDRTNPSAVRFDWAGFTISAWFTGSSVAISLKDGLNFYNVLVDGFPICVLNATVDVTKRTYVLATGLDENVAHIVVLTKRTDPDVGAAEFHGVVLDKGAHLLDSSKHMDANPRRRIEFIGDSLTTGYGDEPVTVPCPFSPDTENNAIAWGSLIAKELNAEVHTESWSGYGISRHWGEHPPASALALPHVWAHALGTDNSTSWDFNEWRPHVVVVNLGTNDYWEPSTMPNDLFNLAYRGFVAQIMSAYESSNEQSLQVLLVCGPVCAGDCCATTRSVAASFEHSVSFVDISDSAHLNPEDIGCNGHPGPSGQQKMAAAVLPILRQLMQWDD